MASVDSRARGNSLNASRRSSQSSSIKHSEEDHKDFSVEELFQRYSIPEIQSLNKKYQQDRSNSKQQLRNLVSDKYRDLISITDEIESAFGASKDLEASLSDFAFKPSKFINFTSNLKFNKIVSEEQIAHKRNIVKRRVLNDIVNVVLTEFHLNLQKHFSDSIFHHTSNYIYYAKIYYIIDFQFQDQLNENITLQQTYFHMRDYFIKFLVNKISTFNTIKYSSFNESDIFNPEECYYPHSLTPLKFNQEIPEFSFNDHERILESSAVNNIPIVNYLVSYILVKSSGSTSLSRSTTLFDFLQFRYDFISGVVSGLAPSEVDKVDFEGLLKYVENTLDYTSDYFENNDFKNRLIKSITVVSKNWDLKEFEGYGQATLNLDPLLVTLPASSVKDLKEFKTKFIDISTGFFTKLTIDPSIQNINKSLMLFHKFVVGLQQVQYHCEEYGIKSRLVDNINNSDESCVLKCLTLTLEVIEGLYEKHLETSTSIIELMSNGTDAKDKLDLFTKDFVQLDLPECFDLITRASLNSSLSTELDLVKKINAWFKTNLDYEIIVLPSTENSKFDFSLDELSGCLVDSNKLDIRWGAFSRKKLLDEFGKISESMNKLFNEKVEAILKALSTTTEEHLNNKSLENVYYLTKILSCMKQNLKELAFVLQLETLISSCFEFIINEIPQVSKTSNITFLDQFEAIGRSITDEDSTQLEPTTPSPKLSSLLFYLSSLILNPVSLNHESGYKNGMIFTNEAVLFKKFKDQWLLESLIPKLYYKGEEKLSKLRVVSLYCNIVFIHCFTSDYPVVETEKFKAWTEDTLDDIELKEITKSITDFYKTSNSTYFPLNL